MKAINKELLEGMSKAMLCSNYLEIDTFFHVVELVVEDEIKERQEHYKLGETTADMIQSLHKMLNDVEDTLRKFNVEL
ncbi:MAG: hypothetical protein J5767_12585 [Paludibacteraceae bacterium]|nr:hypothetical protein [Paludibacteraceae bacterium]